MSAELRPDDFLAFFRAIHGEEPFPWQESLAARVCESGWPRALPLPTGSGKTAAIDIAVFRLALEVAQGGERRAPCRIVFVVDRRLVVDDAFERACRIASALEERRHPVLERVADALASLAESADTPLACVRLRGGTPREPDWVRTPSQPTVIVSTVDQAGSRLLFRGYGISDSMRPIHAGLLGQDALWLLDEAHLSLPLVQTLRSIEELRPKGERHPAEAPLEVVTLSATQDEPVEPLLTEADREHAVLGKRLVASKQAELVSVKGEGALQATCVDRALAFSRAGSRVVAVVVNRVARARRIYEKLFEETHAEGVEPEADLALLIGRTRDLDRLAVLEEILPRMRARDREEGRPLILVATQCVEAGADLDFDALVTEIAPLDSLRQRFGRLNRMGRPIEARAAIVADDSQMASRSSSDAVYGDALKHTWSLLRDKAKVEGRGKKARRTIDFGVEAAMTWLPEGGALRSCLAPREDAPVFLPSFADRWSATSQLPADDPEVALFLHGPRAGPADVQIVWRADFDPSEGLDLCIERLAACPPSALEAVSVPWAEAKRWLARQADAEISDLVVSPGESEELPSARERVMRWFGEEDERTRLVDGGGVWPGDLIIVPASLGGCDRWGWNPRSTDPVADLGEVANELHRGLHVFRLSTAQRADGEGASSDAIAELLASLVDSNDAGVIAALQDCPWVPEVWRERIASGSVRVVRSRCRPGLPLALTLRRGRRSESVTEDDRSSFAARPVSLASHSVGVRDIARSFARKVGLPESVVEDVALAAYLHDAGKAHEAFQAWLHGGDELAASAAEPIAKSGKVSLGRGARERAGLPVGARHEVASLWFALAHPAFAKSHDPDLVLWLVGTHHGWGRPLFPVPRWFHDEPMGWPEAGTRFSADLGDGTIESLAAPDFADLTAWWLDLRNRVHQRYGHWGLARIEAIVRLADHRRSQQEEEA